MNAAPNVASFLPLLPEIVLGIGAMLLLMLGAYRDERVVPVIDAGAIVLLVAAGVILLLLPEGKLVSFNGSFIVDGFARFLKILRFDRFCSSDPAVDRLRQARRTAALRILGSDRALDARHADADLGGRPDRALSRPRADEPAALRRCREPSRQPALDRSGPEVLRARRAVVRHAALRRVAGLRLHRHSHLHRHCACGRAGRRRADLWPRVFVRRLLLQGFGGAVPHVDARRLRRCADAGHGVLCLRAQSRRHGHVRACRSRCLPRHHVRSGSRSWYSFRSPRWRSAHSPPLASATSNG